MTDSEIRTALKVDLDISTTQRDDYLDLLITTAKQFITTEGITLDASAVSDGMLIEMYAAYLYRKRREDIPMPRMLRWALNNRLLQGKGRADE